MAVERVLPTSPKVKIEIINLSSIQDVVARVYIADASGVFPTHSQGFVEFFGSSGTQYQHLAEMLWRAGKIEVDTVSEAAQWLQTTSKVQAMNFLRTVWNTFLAEVCAKINEFFGVSGVPETPGEYFVTADELFQALLNSSNFSVVNGKMTATF